ncbi:MAG: Unknown protein [uncultured Sulfurovum sp.]|uniref:Uncharacterized protein n=1 Tax=uncultured Sulfurovum sp. TaxID=269237 RepID=A0A6S6T2F2_9BACT|nr:MAG: Unknown protein [uncultured Sulfurovum sp.]
MLNIQAILLKIICIIQKSEEGKHNYVQFPP